MREQARRDSHGHDAETSEIEIDGITRPFREDLSQSWAWEMDENDHDDYSKIYRAAIVWTRQASAADFADLPVLLLEDDPTAVVWRTLFDMASQRPEILGARVFGAAANPVILKSYDTGRSAVSLISAAYPHIDGAKRERFERDVLQWTFEEFKRPEKARVELLGTLFEAIGTDNLATDEAKSSLVDAKNSGSDLTNRKPFEVHTSWGDSDQGWLEREGVDIYAPVNAPVLALNEALKKAIETVKGKPTAEQIDAFLDALIALDTALASATELDPLADMDASDTLAEAIGTTLLHKFAPKTDVERWLDRLLVLTHHKDPEPHPDVEKNFAESPHWGSPCPRIRAAGALANIIGRPLVWTRAGLRYQEMLHGDPHPAVRYHLAHGIHLVRMADPHVIWLIIERFFAKERNDTVLRAGLRSVSRLYSVEIDRVEELAIRLSKEFVRRKKEPDDIVWLIVHLAIDKNRPASLTALQGWVADYANHEDDLNEAIGLCRGTILKGMENGDPNLTAIRHRTQAFLWSLMEALEPDVRGLPPSAAPATPSQIVALKLFNEVANQLYFAVGHDKLVPELQDLDRQRQFLAEYGRFVSRLMTLGTPRSVHYLLEMLEHLLDADPALCFDLFSEAMLRTTGVARYEYESMGAALFVKLVGVYLADHRAVFEDASRRARLIDCITVFVEAGWPEARRLFQNLPELLQ
jgi:hypothetical protein